MSPSSAVSEPIGAAVDEIDVVHVVRRVGRPRSAHADVAILDAATEEFIHHGLDGMSVDDVAARARVSKATIYRRYNRKLDLVVAAARRACEERAPLASTGDIRRDLRALGRSLLDRDLLRLLLDLAVERRDLTVEVPRESEDRQYLDDDHCDSNRHASIEDDDRFPLRGRK